MNTNNEPTQPEPAAEAPEADTAAASATESGEIEALQAKLDEAEERFLRAKAEVDNTRRRAEIDVANAHKYAIERFASEILSIKDSLELARAVDFEQGNEIAVEKMFEGVDLTLKLLSSIFEKFALQEVDPAKGDKFDPQEHQAMSTQESDQVAPNHIVNVVQKGYLLNGRLLRPAMVIVAKPPPDDSAGQA